jgi:hypothetical protein
MPRRYYLIVLAATLAGAFLRLWQLTAVPAGLHYDLAATALLGNDVAFSGARPIFIQAYTGHEVLFYYWLAAWFNLIGSSIFSLRLAAALLGVLTLPATFFAVREVLRGEATSLQIAALAAVLIAFAFFHVTFSRFGFRVITQPLVQCLALGFLLRGVRRREVSGHWVLDSVLGGAFTGLAAYTYLSARLFPFPIAVFILALLPGSKRSKYQLPITLFLLTAALVFAPLGLYFVQHPEDFFNRFSQVAPRAGEDGLLWQGIRRAAEMLFLNGEGYDRFNLPGLPLFATFPLGVFFVIGLLATFYALLFKRNHSPLTLAVEWLLLAWLPFMLLPTAISVNEVFPSNVRAFGLTPLVFVFPARGLVVAFRWVQQRLPNPLLGTTYPLTLIALLTLALGTFTTYRQYFVEWANLPTQRLNNDADLTGIAAYLNAQPVDEGVTPYVASIHYRHPTLAYLARDFNSIQWLTGGAVLIIPRDRAALYFDAATAPLPEEWMAGWAAHLEHEQRDANGATEFRVYRLAPNETPPLPEFAALSENFGNAVFLTGYALLPESETLVVDLRWRVENPVEVSDYLPYVRLYDAQGRQWAEAGGFTYPSAEWVVGDVALTRHRIRLPLGLPPGEYTVKVGLYSESQQASLARLNERGSFGGERAMVGKVALSGRPLASLAEFRATNTLTPPTQSTLADLLGYHVRATSARQNERFDLTLFWFAEAPVTTPVRISIGEATVFDGELNVSGALQQRLTLRMPMTVAGPVEVTVKAPGFGEATLLQMEAVPVARTLTAPEAADRLEALFGDPIALTGYTLTPGASTSVTLVWQMRAAQLDADYTVFVHLRDEAGQNVAQADAMPRGGAYPTSVWALGEFVDDPYTFNLAPGNYSLVVGLYEAETGERLPVAAGDELILQKFTVP